MKNTIQCNYVFSAYGVVTNSKLTIPGFKPFNLTTRSESLLQGSILGILAGTCKRMMFVTVIGD